MFGSQGIDFIRTISIVFNVAKSRDPLFPFDLVINANGSVQYGIGCITKKVTRVEKAFDKRGISVVRGISRFQRYTDDPLSPEVLGERIVAQVRADSLKRATAIDIEKSIYLILLHDDQGRYQLHQIPYELPNPSNLKWSISSPSSLLKGEGDDGTVITYSSLREGRFIYYPSYKMITWSSSVFHLEPFALLENLQYGLQARAEIRKLSAIEKLKNLIEKDAEERELQKHLQENPWMFGSEYAQLLERRIWVRDQQKDFMLKRTADDFLEMIEIKRPLNNTPLFSSDNSHKSLYPGVELSKAIGQVINYLEALDADRHSIRSRDEEDTNKIRAKLIIGRDTDKNQIGALRNLNSHIYRIEILTYDQLLRIANRVIEFQ